MFELLLVICIAGTNDCTHGIYGQTYDDQYVCLQAADHILDEVELQYTLANTGVDALASVYCSIPA